MRDSKALEKLNFGRQPGKFGVPYASGYHSFQRVFKLCFRVYVIACYRGGSNNSKTMLENLIGSNAKVVKKCKNNSQLQACFSR